MICVFIVKIIILYNSLPSCALKPIFSNLMKIPSPDFYNVKSSHWRLDKKIWWKKKTFLNNGKLIILIDDL